MNEEGFDITDSKGFHMTFENGWAISVQFGGGNYCDHSNKSFGYHGKSSTAEVMIWDNTGATKTSKIRGQHDIVTNRSTPNEVAKMIQWTAKQKKVE